ncbi:hypothetical protein [Streptomyces sp. NPDC006285]|uniref:hypothetical protein n=1 Tax=Streptomyces sp. NPDC006285 TaxID=3364742 RepID=UPI00368D9447
MGWYEGVPMRLVTHETGRGRRLQHWRDRDGMVGRTPLTAATVDERMSSFIKDRPVRSRRKTVNVLHRREPGQDTHDSIYVVSEPLAQQQAVPVIADGAMEAVDAARRTVFTARLTSNAEAVDRHTVTAACAG